VKRGIGMTAVISSFFLPFMRGARYEVGLADWGREVEIAKVVCALLRVRRRADVFVEWSCAMRHRAAPLWPVGYRPYGATAHDAATTPRAGVRDTNSTSAHQGRSGNVAMWHVKPGLDSSY